MQHTHFFATTIGTCGFAFSERGLTAVQLPEQSEAALVSRLATRGAPATHLPSWAISLEAQLRAHLAGQPADFADVPLDLTGLPEFHRRAYSALRLVPAGQTVSYGELARSLGAPGGARAVGQAMAKNPFPVIVPCHRVVSKNFKLGGFSAYGGLATKERLLALEGVRLGNPSV